MKTCYKPIIVLFLIISATRSGAQQRKVIYTDKEIIQPNLLRYNTADSEDGSVFKGTRNNNLVYLTWQTTTEVNTSHFELQRSENGKDFKPIETITAGRITKNISSYACTVAEYNLSNARLHYRLKIVFTNGKEKFTDMLTLN